MPNLIQSPAWQALLAHHRDTGQVHLRDLFAADPARASRLRIELDGLLLDYSKHRISNETLKLLLTLAKQQDIEGWRTRLFAGDKVNNTEDRPALHMALRSQAERFPQSVDVMPQVREVRQRMRSFAENMLAGRMQGASGKTLRQVVNLGVGGSDLGPRMAVSALRPLLQSQVRVHFVSNADPADLDAVLAGLDPAETLFIVASKTFTTVETLSNARRARAWLLAGLGAGAEAHLGMHFAAATAAPDKATAFGIAASHVFPMWDWVGGRYSLWSAVGLPVAIAAGPDAFEEMLEGAHSMDEHFLQAPAEANLPVLMAMLSVWYVCFFGAQSHAVLAYSEDLRLLPDYLQQLQMESNGKRVDRTGSPLEHPSSAILWGGSGTVTQHSFHQLLLQGTHLVPVDFIVPVQAALKGSVEDQAAQQMLVANALAQGAALMSGSDLLGEMDSPRISPGNRPSSTLLIRRLTPRTLGQLVALYEHKVFAEACLLGINPFDQWGVELGKVLARAIEKGEMATLDASTRALVAQAGEWRR